MPENQSPPTGRWIAFVLVLLAISSLFLLAVRQMLPEKSLVSLPDYEPWGEDVLEAVRGIPVQDGGRIKPLETYAGYKMLGMRGDRLVRIEGKDGETVRIPPTAWMLDTLFRQRQAIKLPTFRIDNSDVIELIGLKARAKRDRYSYEEISEARAKLFELGGEYEELGKNDVELDPVQKQTLTLARSIRDYELLLGYFSFAQGGVELQGAGENGESKVERVSTVMATGGVIQEVIQQAQAQGSGIPVKIQEILRQITDYSNAARYGLVVLPPADPEQREWVSAGTRIWDAMMLKNSGDEAEMERLAAEREAAAEDILALENLYVAALRGEEEFKDQVETWSKEIQERAEERGEYASIPVELTYNKGDWFFKALFLLFLPACLAVILGWLSPKSRWGKAMAIVTWGLTALGLIYATVGITLRSIIMQRPPVGNLYDTIPFITAVAVLVLLVVEFITRRRLALGLAPMLGLAGFALARMYEFGDSSDPMDPLLAVLRSNYWLTIHVLTITIGYAAGLVAAAFGHIYVFLRLFKLDGGDKSLRRLLTRMTYGTIALTLVLSLTGTVLGGIWANDSWGRFWGWDPKENGALMIVLWTLFMLHARMGGILKEWGMNLAAVFLAVIVTFSWWHVNLLGVGLHSYGFSDSKKFAVFLFYGIEGIVLLFGIGYMLVEKLGKRQAKEQAGVNGAKPLQG